jgi:hypothetical protein
MTAPAVTAAQLRPIVERALDKRRNGSDRCVIVAAQPDPVPDLGSVDGLTTTVLGTRSPLEIRAALHDLAVDGDRLLVVLTDLPAHALGDDLLARIINRRPFRVDGWETVCQLFGARQPSADLAARPYLADALIESSPRSGYPKVVARVLDTDTALAALLTVRLGLEADDPAERLVERAGTPEAAGLLRDAGDGLRADLLTHLTTRYGDVARTVVALVVAGHGADLVSWGLAAGALHHPDATGAEVARAVLDRELGSPGVDVDAWRRLEALADVLFRASYDDDQRVRWRTGAADVLAHLDAAGCARHSDVIPAGFDQRLDDVADALVGWHTAPDDERLAEDTRSRIAWLKTHLDRQARSESVLTCDMAARAIRRRSFAVVAEGGLVDVARAYRDDGSWFDRVRVVLSRGSTHPALAGLCRALTAEADRARSEQRTALGGVLAKAALPLPDDLLAVEDVLADVVAPLAAERPVLLVVLDGLSLAAFHEFSAELTGAAWTAVRPVGRPISPAVAVLPTVTELSRTSLLAGTVRRGDGESENRAFAGHPALAQVSAPGLPPVLFHKRDLRVGGLDAPPEELLNAIADTRQRVVGAVINSIDERLKDVVAPTGGWSMNDLHPLRDVLAEARRAGRAVVITADHGHILDRDAEQRPGGGGGERWRPVEGNEPAPDEIVVHGPRVAAGDGRVILPVAEQVRYGTRRNGYHGGLTLQELFVPLVVLVIDDLDGWEPTSLAPPAWWHHQPIAVPAPVPTPTPAPRRTPAVAAPAPTPTLFDDSDAEPEPNRAVMGRTGHADTPVPELVARLLTSDLFSAQMANPRVRVGADDVAAVLAHLVDGTASTEDDIAAITGLAPARMSRFVAQLQELLNVEGYPVVRATGTEVRLDVALLTRQFDL